MRAGLIVLTLLAAALGAGGGFAGGFVFAVIHRVQTDTQVSCALLQAAETAGYITREQRGHLVDAVVPPGSANAEIRPATDWTKVFADVWWDSIREDQKSGCPDV